MSIREKINKMRDEVECLYFDEFCNFLELNSTIDFKDRELVMKELCKHFDTVRSVQIKKTPKSRTVANSAGPKPADIKRNYDIDEFIAEFLEGDGKGCSYISDRGPNPGKVCGSTDISPELLSNSDKKTYRCKTHESRTKTFDEMVEIINKKGGNVVKKTKSKKDLDEDGEGVSRYLLGKNTAYTPKSAKFDPTTPFEFKGLKENQMLCFKDSTGYSVVLIEKIENTTYCLGEIKGPFKMFDVKDKVPLDYQQTLVKLSPEVIKSIESRGFIYKYTPYVPDEEVKETPEENGEEEEEVKKRDEVELLEEVKETPQAPKKPMKKMEIVKDESENDNDESDEFPSPINNKKKVENKSSKTEDKPVLSKRPTIPQPLSDEENEF